MSLGEISFTNPYNAPRLGTGKTAYHLRSLANTGCVQVTTKEKKIAVICMQDIHLRAA